MYPLPTPTNNSPANNGGNTAGNEGLQDIILDEARGKVYVTNSGDGTVSVLDGASNTLVATVTVGTTPLGVAVNPLTNRIYVANNGSNTLSVLDGASNTVVASVTRRRTKAAPPSASSCSARASTGTKIAVNVASSTSAATRLGS